MRFKNNFTTQNTLTTKPSMHMSTHTFIDNRKRFRSPVFIVLFGLIVFLSTFDMAGSQNRTYSEETNLFAQLASTQNKSEDSLLSIQFSNITIQDALELLAKKINVGFSYNPEIIPGKRVSFSMSNVPPHEIIYRLLDGTNLEPVLPPSKDVIVIREKVALPAVDIFQQSITGTVVDAETSEPLPGVNVIAGDGVEDLPIGSTTNLDGQYEIELPDEVTTLVFSYVGYQRQEVPINGRSEINIQLGQDVQMLEDIVVVGYGQQQRSDITGSVISISGENLNAIQTENVAESIQGQAAGVLVTQSSGKPGSNMDVLIRGATSIGDNNPLYVIDGIPTQNLSGINVSNIESVDILKDASAASIYGSRAAGGVVMITTNRGNRGDTQVQFSAKTGISNIPENRRIEVMNTEQFRDFSVEAFESAGLLIPQAWQEPYLSQNLQQNTDWQSHLFRKGIIQDYNLTISGGNENAIYSFTGGFLDEEGTVIETGYERLSFQVKSEFYIGENDQLTIGENISLSRSKEIGQTTTTTFGQTFQQSPAMKVRCPERLGGFCGANNFNSPGDRTNEIALLHLIDHDDITERLFGSAYAEYNILNNLSFRSTFSADIANGNVETYTPLYDLSNVVNFERDLNQIWSDSRALILDNILSYNVSFSEKHTIESIAGYSQEKREIENIIGSAEGFPSENLRAFNAATGQKVLTGGTSESRLRSYFGRILYNYDDRYRVQFSVRRDGSSRFGRESRWGTFPAGAVSWSIHNESFMADYENLSRMTLRGSWGITGSQQIPDFASIPSAEPVANYIFGTNGTLAPGTAILTLGNSKLQWQETEELDIGLDLDFFDGRLSFVFGYYQKNTSNVLLRPAVITTSGIRRNNGPFQNIGEVQNKGLEFSSSYQGSINNNLSFRIQGNISTLKNEVISLGRGVNEIVEFVSKTEGFVQTITRPGSEIGAFYGHISEGPFRDQAEIDNHAAQGGAEPGDLKFRDLNGDGVINDDDRTIIGSPFPDLFYGMTVNLNYKNLGLRIQMDGVQGRDIMALREDNDPTGINNVSRRFLDRWTPENPDGVHPRATAADPNTNLRSSTYLMEDGSYLAIRNLTLSYDISPELLSQWVNIRNLRLSLSSNNLAWFTSYNGYNPELGAGSGSRASLTRSIDAGSYPISRTFHIGIDIGF